jgi:hypothetical protein
LENIVTWEGRAFYYFLKLEIEGFLRVENDYEIQGFFYCSQMEELNLRLKFFSLFRWRIVRQVEESSNIKV